MVVGAFVGAAVVVGAGVVIGAAAVVVIAAVVVAAVDGLNNLKDSAFPSRTVFLHGVLKKLHHPLLKYVILLHFRLATHFAWHACRVGSFPGDDEMYTSPASVSHEPLSSTSSHFPTTIFGFVVIDPGGNQGEMINREKSRVKVKRCCFKAYIKHVCVYI